MKFGELLAASLISGWEAHYFDYWKMKEYVKRHTMVVEGRVPDFDHSEFVALFIKEERRVALFVNGKLAEIVNELEYETNRYDTYNAHVAQQIGAQVIKFDRFVNDAFNAQQKILKKYRKWTGQSTSPWFDEANCSMARAKNSVHALVVALSKLSSRQWAKADSWIPPETFVRKTVKYWVRPEHATAAKLFVIQHLPILEVNETPFPSRSIEGEQHSQIHNYLSSVYMDNNAAVCYHTRIALEEGANLLRVRWYGGKEGPDGLPRPASGATFFMELKTHHNPDVSGLKSTKERFPITANMIPAFMSGKLTADQVIDAMVAQGQIKEGKALEQKELATYIQHFITSNQLKPWIRTVYHRTAFQRSDNNDVRISFDLPLILHPELEWDGKNWMDLFKANNKDAKPFGYGVLEVKTSDEPPSWVQELLATGWLIRVEKFSKFQHATAVFHTHAVKLMPYWIHSDIAKQIAGEKSDTAQELVIKTMYAGGSQLSDPGDSAMKGPHSNDDAAPLSLPLAAPQSPVRALNGEDLFTPLLQADIGRAGNSLRSSSPTVRRRTMDDVMSQKSGRGGGGEAPQSSKAIPVAAAPPPRGTNLTRMRVEPKVFFANERTFLKWMFAVVILISVSMAIMSLNERSVIPGVVLLGVAAVLILYAVGLYRWRLNKILQREGTRFDDRIGPYLIAVSLLTAAGLAFGYAWSNGHSEVFQCQRENTLFSPIPVDNVTTMVTVYGAASLSLVDAVGRASVCLTQDLMESLQNLQPDSKKEKAKPTTVNWNVNNTFLAPLSTFHDPSLAYLKFSTSEKTLNFNIRNDSQQHKTYLQHLNTVLGTATNEVRAYGNDALFYTTLVLSTIVAPPTTGAEVNALFQAPFFNDTESFRAENVLAVDFEFAKVDLGVSKGTLRIQPRFRNVDDQAVVRNPYEVDIGMRLTTELGVEFSYSSLRQAQAFVAALYRNEVSEEDIKAKWKN